ALSYPLGTEFHLPHGLSNALLLPHVMEFNYGSNPQKYADVALALGCSSSETLAATAEQGIAWVKQFIQDCGIPARLRDLDIPEAVLPQLAAEAMKITRLLVNNPREVT